MIIDLLIIYNQCNIPMLSSVTIWTKVNKQLAAGPSDNKRQKLLLQHSYREDRRQVEGKAVAAIRKNPKYFFSYVRKRSKLFTGIGPC